MWRKSECGAVEGWHGPFITPEWIKEDRDTSFWLWPSHPELTPALTSRRSSPPRVTMQTTPTQHKHQSRKRDKWQWGAEWHRTGPRREEAGGRNHLDSSQLQELAFNKKGRGGNPPPPKKTPPKTYLVLPLPFLLRLFLKSLFPTAFNHNYFNISKAEREIDPCDWVACFCLSVLSHINCPGFHAVCSNLIHTAALPLSHVDTRVGEVKMRIVRWFCIIYSARSWTALLIACMRKEVALYQHFEVPPHDSSGKS